MKERFRVTVRRGDEEVVVEAPAGANLRRLLLDHGLSPYTRWTRRANCGGRGVCATCGVRIEEAPAPRHWHDRVGDAFGYPRLSCQITVERDLTVRLLEEKVIWGAPWTQE